MGRVPLMLTPQLHWVGGLTSPQQPDRGGGGGGVLATAENPRLFSGTLILSSPLDKAAELEFDAICNLKTFFKFKKKRGR